MRSAVPLMIFLLALLSPTALMAEGSGPVVTRVEARAVIVRRAPANMPPPAIEAQARLVIADRVVTRQDGPNATIAYY